MRKGLVVILLLVGASLCSAFVSTNVPLGHWSYDAIDKLVGQGLIDGAMMATKPLSRLEMARHLIEAIEKAQQRNEKNEIILSLIDRLKEEFKDELITAGILDGNHVEGFINPIEDPYIRYIFGNNRPYLENQRGDVFERRSNYRLGFSSRMKFHDTAAFYFHPEYVDPSPDGDSDIGLIEGYGKLALGNFEIELGKDSLWWGPGYHGSLLMSNNAEPFKMIKISNPFPKKLPWIFERLGPFKATWFLTELENNRSVPETKLTGLRFNFKPRRAFDIGISRAIMFGGSGRPSVGLNDYLRMWRPPEDPQSNQLAGFDASFLLPLDEKMPAKSLKLYTDWIGEDEAAGLPPKWGRLFGMQINDILRTGRTDLRVEFASNHVPHYPNVFYTHSPYRSGYTYKGRMIGHHMGTDTQDMFFRLTHYLKDDMILGLEYNKQTGLSTANRQAVDQFGVDLTFFTPKNWQLKTGYRYENVRNPANRQDSHVLQLQLVYSF